MRSQNRELLLDSDEEFIFVEAAQINSDLTAADLTKNLETNKKQFSIDTVLLNKYGLQFRRKLKMQHITKDKKEDQFLLSTNHPKMQSNKESKKIF